MNRKRVSIAFIVLLLDQLFKSIIQINNTNIILINNLLSIRYVSNTGAAFSFLSGHNIILIIITLILLTLIYHISFSFKGCLYDYAFGMIYGGIIGNLLDRVIYGYVRDFISILRFPIFNIADSFIVIGVLLVIIYMLYEEYKNENSSRRRVKRKNR